MTEQVKLHGFLQLRDVVLYRIKRAGVTVLAAVRARQATHKDD